jgi:hypothetical protein
MLQKVRTTSTWICSATSWLSICTIESILDCGILIICVDDEDVLYEELYQFSGHLNLFELLLDWTIFVLVNYNIFVMFSVNLELYWLAKSLYRPCMRPCRFAWVKGALMRLHRHPNFGLNSSRFGPQSAQYPQAIADPILASKIGN